LSLSSKGSPPFFSSTSDLCFSPHEFSALCTCDFSPLYLLASPQRHPCGNAAVFFFPSFLVPRPVFPRGAGVFPLSGLTGRHLPPPLLPRRWWKQCLPGGRTLDVPSFRRPGLTPRRCRPRSSLAFSRFEGISPKVRWGPTGPMFFFPASPFSR